jgi:carbamoyltransferase
MNGQTQLTEVENNFKQHQTPRSGNIMYILGINAYHADASACILKDGQLIAATEEERFTRIKHWAGFPAQAVRFCLEEAGIGIEQVDHITVGRDPRAKLGRKIMYQFTQIGNWRGLFDRLQNSAKMASLEQEVAAALGVPASQIRARIHNIEHHRSHLASAFFASPFEEAALLSIDGSGDFTTTMLAIGRGNQIEVLDSVDFPVSCGVFYTAFTQFLGFYNYGDEYKVMGLAPYGQPKYLKELREIILLKDNGLFTWDTAYFRSSREGAIMSFENNVPVIPALFSKKFEDVFGPARQKDEPLTQHHKDIAASVQRMTEELILHILTHLQKRTGLKNVCIAGGVAQNSVANGKVIGNTGFEQLYVPSAGHDAGISIGSALYCHNAVLGQPRLAPIYTAYTGKQASNDQIEQMLRQKGIAYERIDDEAILLDRVTDQLIAPGVVGWFHGRAEFGPRALGARSIIADPRNPQARDLLNEKIKRRELFRPFAPSILREYVSDYFEKDEPVPFMERVFPIRPEKHAAIPAVTHVDGTGRLQTVDRSVSPRYYALIERFRQKTGVPILLNTSFNENEPIVNTPEQALDCYLRTQMDMIVLENCVVQRKG